MADSQHDANDDGNHGTKRDATRAGKYISLVGVIVLGCGLCATSADSPAGC
jgi:hypothetical protein